MSSAIAKLILRMMPLASVRGFGTSLYLIKEQLYLFWDAEDVVIQYHPAKSEYVNVHDNCLHLWRPVGVELPTPPRELVG